MNSNKRLTYSHTLVSSTRGLGSGPLWHSNPHIFKSSMWKQCSVHLMSTHSFTHFKPCLGYFLSLAHCKHYKHSFMLRCLCISQDKWLFVFNTDKFLSNIFICGWLNLWIANPQNQRSTYVCFVKLLFSLNYADILSPLVWCFERHLS